MRSPQIQTQTQKTALVMAGGTGGHIFPGLAVAQALREAGWRVHWLGAPASMEERLVPPQGFAFEAIAFSGLRGKGLGTWLRLPVRLWQALSQSAAVLRRLKPDVVLGFGGYISFPAGLAAVWLGRPLVLHEQNSVAGLANRLLAKRAQRVLTAFPQALPNATWIGNPLRAPFLQQAQPAARLADRRGPLRLLVLGGSLGAQALNQTVPQALALMPAGQRPQVIHQGGAKQIEALRAHYAQAGLLADGPSVGEAVAIELTPFIEDTASAMAWADVVVCRAGASTVTELAAVGAAALFVPFPHAVDDHQTHNAQFLVQAQAAWLLPQAELTPQRLADWLSGLDREQLLKHAMQAKNLAKPHATEQVVQVCENLVRAVA